MSNIKIQVDFYNQEQKDLIKKNFPEDFKLIDQVAGKKIEVSLEDFKTYAFFRLQFNKKGRWSSFLDLKPMTKHWDLYENYFGVQGDKLINVCPDDRIEALEVPEMLGVAGGLSVASKIYGFTQADWTKIPITIEHKDFDFNHTSCLDRRFINIEAKGSIIDNNAYKTAPVSNHKGKILEKKHDPGFKAKYDYKRDCCIGIITVADRSNYLQSWLVDPYIENFNGSGEKFKLLKRLYFYQSLLHLISKRSYLTILLANRIKAIEVVDDYKSFDNLPLVNYNFEKIQLTDSFINSRSGNKDKSIIGTTFIIDRFIYFIGIDLSMIYRIIDQRFDQILSLKTISSTNSTTLSCNISKDKGKAIFSSESSKIRRQKQQTENENIILFDMDVDLIKNTSGLCIARQNL